MTARHNDYEELRDTLEGECIVGDVDCLPVPGLEVDPDLVKECLRERDELVVRARKLEYELGQLRKEHARTKVTLGMVEKHLNELRAWARKRPAL